ncbi:phosphohistidine phosphatase SixA [Pseudomonas sp. TE3786]
MLVTAPEVLVASPALPVKPFARWRKLLVPGVVLLLLVLLAAWLMRPAYALDLSRAAHMSESGLLQRWKNGEVVVLVRHAERCDQSSNPCLGHPGGITVEGSDAARHVGDAFKSLGMAHTDVYSSPLERTVQTTSFMFGQNVATQEWLRTCESSLQHDMLAHKAPRRNLLLVTHSTCINALEDELDRSGGHYDSAYASALFVAVDGRTGKPELLGFMNADDWDHVLKGAPL